MTFKKNQLPYNFIGDSMVNLRVIQSIHNYSVKRMFNLKIFFDLLVFFGTIIIRINFHLPIKMF